MQIEKNQNLSSSLWVVVVIILPHEGTVRSLIDSKNFEFPISFSIISKGQKNVILKPMLKCPG